MFNVLEIDDANAIFKYFQNNYVALSFEICKLFRKAANKKGVRVVIHIC